MQKKLIIGITAEGSVNLLRGQLKYFKDKGYDTYLMSPDSLRVQEFCKKEGCTHLSIKIEREISLFKDIKTLFQIIQLFKNIKPEIINFGTPKVSLLGMIAGYLTRVPFRIYTCRGFRFEHEHGLKRRILVVMEKITSKLAHKVICISPSLEKLAVNLQIVDAQKSLVISKGSSNGINLSLFKPLENDNPEKCIDLKKRFDLQDKKVIGFIGRVVDRKGVNELFNVFQRLYAADNSLLLLIIGPVELSQIQRKELIEEMNTHPGVIMVGSIPQDEIPPYFLLFDLFVLPAWWEGFGNVLIQAAAMGIPVLTTKSTGVVDAVSDGFNGICIEAKNEFVLESTIKEILNNFDMRASFQENGKTWASNFDQEIIWAGLEKIYQHK